MRGFGLLLCTLGGRFGSLFLLLELAFSAKPSAIAAHGLEDYGHRFGSIVICRDNIINICRITASVYHGKYGDAEAFGLFSRRWPLSTSTTNRAAGRRVQVSDRTEVLLEFGTLAGDLEFSLLEKLSKRAIGRHLVDHGHFFDSFTYCGEVCKHTARPTFRNIRHVDCGHRLRNGVLACFFVATNRTRRPLLAICLSAAAASSIFITVL